MVEKYKESDPCNHCGTPIVLKKHKPNWKPKKKQPYYFSEWLACPNCKTIWYNESAKVFLTAKGKQQSDRHERQYQDYKQTESAFERWMDKD